MEKKVYRSPNAGQPLISTISSGCKTPIIEIKFCNLVKPFRYPNSPTIPRYSVTCVLDPQEHGDFLDGIKSIERDEQVDSIIKNENEKENGSWVTSGKVLLKFQGKDIIPVYDASSEPEQQVILEDELAKGEKVVVVYDILRYTKKNTAKVEHGLSFKPTAIYWYPEG